MGFAISEIQTEAITPELNFQQDTEMDATPAP